MKRKLRLVPDDGIEHDVDNLTECLSIIWDEPSAMKLGKTRSLLDHLSDMMKIGGFKNGSAVGASD
jgi:hypothetical protein